MLVRRELPADVDVVRDVLAAAFADPPCIPDRVPGGIPPEVGLVDALRADEDWLPALAMVAELDGQVCGYVTCSRARVGDADAPVLGLGPLAVLPDSQRRGVGSALMHAVLGAADALGEPLVVLLGHADYYPRFGFGPAADLGITPPVPGWAPHFQARALTGYDPALRGTFRYARPFSET